MSSYPPPPPPTPRTRPPRTTTGHTKDMALGDTTRFPTGADGTPRPNFGQFVPLRFPWTTCSGALLRTPMPPEPTHMPCHTLPSGPRPEPCPTPCHVRPMSWCCAPPCAICCAPRPLQCHSQAREHFCSVLCGPVPFVAIPCNAGTSGKSGHHPKDRRPSSAADFHMFFADAHQPFIGGEVCTHGLQRVGDA